jgi:hypothetical protein
MLETTTETQSQDLERVVYGNIKELVSEWQASKDDRSLWDYLGMPEYALKDWLKRCRDGVNDA